MTPSNAATYELMIDPPAPEGNLDTRSLHRLPGRHRVTNSSATACANSPATSLSSRAPTAWPTSSPSSPTPAGSPARRAAGYEARGRSLDSALAYEYGRDNAYAGEYEDALAARLRDEE